MDEVCFVSLYHDLKWRVSYFQFQFLVVKMHIAINRQSFDDKSKQTNWSFQIFYHNINISYLIAGNISHFSKLITYLQRQFTCSKECYRQLWYKMILENLRILKQSKTKNVNCKTFQNKCGLIKRVWDLKFVNFHITKSISFNSWIL